MPIIPESWRSDVFVTTLTDDADIIELSDGRILVTWSSTTNDDIYGRVFDQLGNLITGPDPYSTFYTSGVQDNARIAPTPDGGWLVVFEDEISSGTALRLEAYNSAGARVDNASIAAVTGEDFINADIDVSSASSALIAYEEQNGSNDSDYEYRIYDPSTDSQGGAVNLNFAGAFGATDFGNAIQVKTLDNGNYLVIALTQTSTVIGPPEFPIAFWRDLYLEYAIISDTGSYVKLPTPIAHADNNSTSKDEYIRGYDTAALVGGDFIVAWADDEITAPGIETIKVQRYTDVGNATGSIHTIESGTADSENQPQVTALEDGGYIVSWNYDTDRIAQRFDGSGATVGAQFTIEDGATATLLSDGRFVYFNDSSSGLEFYDTRDTDNQNTASGDYIGTIDGDVIYNYANDGYGWDGDDILIQQTSGESLYGGEGNDELRHDGEVIMGAPTTLDGENGIDTLMVASNTGWRVDLTVDFITNNNTYFDFILNIENVDGNIGDDTLRGNAENNILRGFSGEDSLIGESGTDTLYGGNDDDSLEGGNGNDTLYGDNHNDALYGGNGGDFLYGGNGDDELDGDGGSDELYGEDGNDALYQNADGSTVNLLNGGGDIDTWHLASLGGGYTGSDWTVNLATGFSQALQNGVLTTIVNTVSIENVISGNGQDDITGDSVGNILNGQGDEDILRGAAGDDTLFGGNANDSLYGDAGSDIVNGEAGDDDIYNAYTGGGDVDTIDGGSGTDSLYLDAGVNTDWSVVLNASGGQAASGAGGSLHTVNFTEIESLNLGDGDDDIIGLSNIMTLNTRGGDDTLIYWQGLANLDMGDDDDELSVDWAITGFVNNVILSGGSGVDTLTFYNFDMQSTDTVVLAGAYSNIGSTNYLLGFDNYDGRNNLSFSHEAIIGTSSDNIIWGSGGDNVISGLGGDDYFMGGLGADKLDGGAGADTADYSDSSVGVFVDLRNGTATGGTAEGDSFVDVENITGSNHSDTIYGSSLSDNHLIGGEETDHLFGIGGTNILDGGAGYDYLVSGSGADSFIGGADGARVSYGSSSGGVTINLVTGIASGNGATGDTFDAILDISGSTYNDDLTGTADDNVLYGMQGDDIIDGGAGDDVIRGDNYTSGFGHDTIFGGSGMDDIHGGQGVDVIYGGSQDDIIDGGEGDDIIDGGSHTDTIYGGEGNDWISGGYQVDYLDGGNGVDTVDYTYSSADLTVDLAQGFAYVTTSGPGGETVTNFENVNMGNGSNVVIGNDLANGLTGGTGIDTLQGGLGADILMGGEGDDWLEGGGGADIIDGGDGVDLASYASANNSVEVNLGSGLATGSHANGDTLHSIENLTGSNNGDILTGNNDANLLSGLSGRDNIGGSGGDDEIYGGTGNDTIRGGAGADHLDGGDGVDIVRYNGSSEGVVVNLLSGFAAGGQAEGDTVLNFEKLFGSNHDDALLGNAENNRIFGLSGDDTIAGYGGFDKIWGGSGADIFYTLVVGGVTNIMDFEDDVDVFNVADFGYNSLSEVLAQMDQLGQNVRFRDGNGNNVIIRDIDLADIQDDIVF